MHGEQLPCPDLPSTLPELGTAAQVLKAAELVSREPETVTGVDTPACPPQSVSSASEGVT